jgi:hypothetical protein
MCILCMCIQYASAPVKNVSTPLKLDQGERVQQVKQRIERSKASKPSKALKQVKQAKAEEK